MSCAMDECSLMEFAANEGFQSNVGTTDGAKLLTVGVDARYEMALQMLSSCSSCCKIGSTWMHSVCPVFRYNHAGVGANPELHALFFWLAAFLNIPLHAVFVFDGPTRPCMKQQKQIREPCHWLASAFQEMLTAFGFAWYEVCACALPHYL